MATLNDIETQLARQFDVEHLSVYADYLQSIGDPRGELIALDLQRVPLSPHYDRVMADWLGRSEHALRQTMNFRYGFVSQLRLFDDRRPLETLRVLFESPAAPFVLRIHLEGNADDLPAILARLVEREHPWLQRLEIRTSYAPYVPRPPLFDDALCRTLAAATPSLDSLDVRGHAMFGALGHPQLRAMRVHNATGIASLFEPDGGDAAVFPSLRYLALSLDGEYHQPQIPAARLAGVLSPARLPRLTRLDLSVSPRSALVDPQALLMASGLRHQLTHIHASTWRVEQTDALVRLADDLPALIDLTIDELYAPPGCRIPPRVAVKRIIGPHYVDGELLFDIRALRPR